MNKVKCCYCNEEMDFGSTYVDFTIPEAIGHKRCVMAYSNQIKKGAQKMKQVRCCKCGEILSVEEAWSNLAINGAVGHEECVMAYVKENQPRNDYHKVKLVLGDWSDDGHGKYKEIEFVSNYPVDIIQQAYRDSCKLTGVQFNYNEDYTDGLCKGYGSWRQIFTEYEDNCMKVEAIEVLRAHGLDPAEYCNEIYTDEDFEKGNEMAFSSENVADLIMDFIKLSMPNDWRYDKIESDSKAINGWWGNLNHQFGYGLFY